MIRPDQIPAESVKAAWQAMMAPDALAMHRAIAAAINAWPDGAVLWKHDPDDTAFLLPLLPHEEGDA